LAKAVSIQRQAARTHTLSLSHLLKGEKKKRRKGDCGEMGSLGVGCVGFKGGREERESVEIDFIWI